MRETSTVLSNLRLVVRVHKTMKKFDMARVFSPVGPFPLCDSFGMQTAVAVLDKSLDPGRYETHVQWSTFRKIRSAVTNVSQASVGGLGDVVGAYEKTRTWIYNVPTHTFFFTRFMGGLHRRVGEVVKRDEPITIQIMKAIQKMLELEWSKCANNLDITLVELLEIARRGLWFTASFCTGLRGEEMMQIELEGTLSSLVHFYTPSEGLESHFELVVTGPTKNHRVSGSKFSIPCVGITTLSKLKPGVWLHRYSKLMRMMGRKGGMLFAQTSAAPKLCEYEDEFFGVLEAMQAQRPDLISESVDVREDFGILRSLRRGITAHATNIDTPERIIRAVNRWRQERRVDVAVLDMPEMYARLDALKPTILRYSSPI